MYEYGTIMDTIKETCGDVDNNTLDSINRQIEGADYSWISEAEQDYWDIHF